MKKKVKKIFVAVGVIFFLLETGELYLRKVWGFCDTVLMQADPAFEYIAQPNQDRKRFKKRVVYNEYSQRNEPVDSTAFIILGLGDSVINGGVLTDQDSLATTLLSRNLMIGGSGVQVLNISAGSWGPDNCMAYMERYGTFGASLAFLVCSSHDAHDIMDFAPIVDIQLSYLSTQYRSALFELSERYLYPRLKGILSSFSSGRKDKTVEEIHKPGKVFNPGFEKLVTYFKERQIPFLIYLHAEKNEQEKDQFNSEGEEILSFCKDHGVSVKTDLGILTDTDYRDNIHLSEHGQRKLYDELKTFFQLYEN